MNKLFTQYPYNLDENLINTGINKSVQLGKESFKESEILKKIFSCIDLTTLKETDSKSSVRLFVNKVNTFNTDYPSMPNIAAICVYPNFASLVTNTLNVENVNRAVVAAGFPSSQTFTDIKVTEASMAIDDGANEIDIVIAVGEFLDNNYPYVFDEIKRVKSVCGEDIHLKVILETGSLQSPELIWKASILAMEAGADFIKTSTGKISPAASLEAAYVMCSAIKEYTTQTGKMVGFKAAGGISTSEQAVQYYNLAKDILGDLWLNNLWFRIGASSLANNILRDIIVLENNDTEVQKYF